MCLGIPGRVQQIYEANGVRMGKVNFGGIVKDVCLEYVPDIRVGDYTIVHVGFAITQVDEASAQETLKMLQEIDVVEQELHPEQHSGKATAPACPVDPWDGAASLTPRNFVATPSPKGGTSLG